MRKVLIAVYKPVLKTMTFAYGVLLCAHSQFHTIHNDCVGAAAIQYTVGSVLVALAIPSSPDRVCEKLLVVSNGAVWARSLYVVSTIVTFDFAASVAAVAAETGDATPLCSVLATVLGVGTDAQVAAWLARFTCCVTVLGLDSSCNLGLLPLLKRGACDLGYVVDYVVDAAKSIFASTRRLFVNTEMLISSGWKHLVDPARRFVERCIVDPTVDAIAAMAGAIYKGEAWIENFVINVILIPIIQAVINALTWIKDTVVVPTINCVWDALKTGWSAACTCYRLSRDSIVIPAYNFGCQTALSMYNWSVAAYSFVRDNVVLPCWNHACRAAQAVWSWTCAGYRGGRDYVVLPCWNHACRAARAVWSWTCAGYRGGRDYVVLPCWNHACRAARVLLDGVCAACSYVSNSIIIPAAIGMWNRLCRSTLFVRDNVLLPVCRLFVRVLKFAWDVIMAAAEWARDWLIMPAVEWSIWAAKLVYRVATSNASFTIFVWYCAFTFAKSAFRLLLDGQVDLTFATSRGAARFCMLAYAGWSLCPLALCLAGRAIRDLNVHNPFFAVSPRVDKLGYRSEKFATTWLKHVDLGVINFAKRIVYKAANTTVSIFEMGLSLLKDGVVAIFNAALNAVEAVRDIASFLGKQLFKIFGLIWDNPYLGLATSIAVGAAVYQLHARGELDALLRLGPEYVNKSMNLAGWAAHFAGELSFRLLHIVQSCFNSTILPLTGVAFDVTVGAASGSFASLGTSLLTVTVDPLGMLSSKELACAVVLMTTAISRTMSGVDVSDAEINSVSQFAIGTAIGLAKPILVIFLAGSGFCWGYVTVYTLVWWITSCVHVFSTNMNSRRDWTQIHRAIQHPKTLQAVIWRIKPNMTWGWEQDTAMHLIARNNFKFPDVCGDMLVQSDSGCNRVEWLEALEACNQARMTPCRVAQQTANMRFVKWATVLPQLEQFWVPELFRLCHPRQQLTVLKVMLVANRLGELDYEQLDDAPSDVAARVGGRELSLGFPSDERPAQWEIWEGQKVASLPALPNEVWLQILGFVRCSELVKSR